MRPRYEGKPTAESPLRGDMHGGPAVMLTSRSRPTQPTTANTSGRQRTSTDGLPQATRAAALVSRVAIWLRDEETNAGGASVADGTLTEPPWHLLLRRHVATDGLSRERRDLSMSYMTDLYSVCREPGQLDGPDSIRSRRRQGGVEVAVLVVGEATGVTAEQDAALARRLYPEGSLPAGFRIRMAGPMDGGWRIVTLWDSEADWERFREERLTPALADVGSVPADTVGAVEPWPIETVLTVWEL